MTFYSPSLKQFAKKAGIDDFHTHSLRHKFATELLERGADIRVIQELLGHTNLTATQVYLSVTSKRIREAVSLLDKEKSEGMEDKGFEKLLEMVKEI